MQSIFLASSFHERDKDLVASIEKVIRAFGIEPKMGRSLGGEPPEPAIEELIESSDALIALCTKREEDDGWPTHPWVLGEYGHAVSIRKPAIAIVEKGITWSKTKHNARVPIELDRGEFGQVIVALVEQLGMWRKQSAETGLSSNATPEVGQHAGGMTAVQVNLFIKKSLRFIAKSNKPLLDEAFITQDIALTQWAAEALLNSRLESLDALPPPTLDEDYITNAEYQLFLEHKRAEKDPREPDFWKRERFREGQALQPILGVRGPGRDSDVNSDVSDFCEWLTEWRKSDRRYRVPLEKDVQNLRCQIAHSRSNSGKKISPFGTRKMTRKVLYIGTSSRLLQAVKMANWAGLLTRKHSATLIVLGSQ